MRVGYDEGKETRTDRLQVGYAVQYGGGWKIVLEIEKDDTGRYRLLLTGGDEFVCDADTQWMLRPDRATLHYPDGDERGLEL